MFVDELVRQAERATWSDADGTWWGHLEEYDRTGGVIREWESPPCASRMCAVMHTYLARGASYVALHICRFDAKCYDVIE